MKKLLAFILTAVLMLSCLTACINGTNRFYNSKVLKEFQITDFPKPQGAEDFEATNSRLSFNTTAEGFEDYAEQLYTYLVEKDFKYFGYRGNEISNFFGGAPTYEFYLSSEFSEHQYLVDRHGNEYENCYVFVFSNELSEDSLINECAIELIYRPDDEEHNTHVCIYYDKNVFTGYTLITDNTPEHEHTYGDWQYDEFKHWREYICGCELEAEMDTHTNDDGNALCDVCGYNVGVKEDYVVYCQYYYTNEYGSNTHTQISLEDVDVSILVKISNSLSYTDGDPGSSPTKIKYCIRHYDTDTDPFFVTGNEQYLDLTANFTNERADVTYSIDYVNSQIIRVYTTPEGEVEGYAKLSEEQLDAIKNAFQLVADVLETQK